MSARSIKFTPDDLPRLRNYYAQNFFAFARHVLGYDRLVLDVHGPICDFISSSPGDGRCRSSNRGPLPVLPPSEPLKTRMRRLALFTPRGTFKSTIVAVAYPLWRWVRNPELKVLICGYNILRPRAIIKEIQGHLEGNDRLRALYGNFRAPSCAWTKDGFELWNPSKGRKTSSRNMMSCVGVGTGTGIAGLHPDIAIVDDIVNEQTVNSLEMMEASREFLRYLSSTFVPGTEEIITGTIYDEHDAYQDIIRNPYFDVYLRGAIDNKQELFFPQEQDWDFLKLKRLELGERVFANQYLNDPISDETSMFKSAWVDSVLVDPVSVDVSKFRIIMAVDPAITVNKRSDHTGICVCGQDANKHIWVFEAIKRKMQPAELTAELKRIYSKWNPEYMLMEEENAFKLMRPMLERYDPAFGASLRYKSFTPDRTRSKKNRIRALVPLFEFGFVKIFKNQVDFISEVRRYSGAPTDDDNILDAFEMCVSRLRPPLITVPVKVEQIIRDRRLDEDRDIGRENQPEERRPFENIFFS